MEKNVDRKNSEKDVRNVNLITHTVSIVEQNETLAFLYSKRNFNNQNHVIVCWFESLAYANPFFSCS